MLVKSWLGIKHCASPICWIWQNRDKKFLEVDETSKQFEKA